MPFMKKKVNIISSQTAAAWTNNIKKRKNETQENGDKQWVVCCRFCLQDSVEHRSSYLVCDRIKRENSQTRKSKQRFVWQGPIEQSHLVCVYIVDGLYMEIMAFISMGYLTCSFILFFFDVTFFVNRKCPVSITSIQVATDQLTLYCVRRVIGLLQE